jgi:hypothetical protein
MLVAVAPLAALAQADAKFLTTCAFSKGDPAGKVKQFYGLAREPQQLEKPIPDGTTFEYHLAQYGVWIFFDSQALVSSLRFDAPFRGKISGVAVGDDADRLRAANGEPVRRFQGLPDAVAGERRQQRIEDTLNALPDPSPKAQVTEAFAEIVRLLKAPPEYTTAWVYNPGKPWFVRYDLGVAGVQLIFVGSCQPET